MDVLKLELNDLKRVVLGLLKPRNVAIAACGLGASWFFHFTFKLYRLRKKYRHIPGPPSKGYESVFIRAFTMVYTSFLFQEYSASTLGIFSNFRSGLKRARFSQRFASNCKASKCGHRCGKWLSNLI